MATNVNVLQTFKLLNPLGFSYSLIIRGKHKFHKMRVNNILRDADLPKDVEKEWKQSCPEFPELASVHLPKYIFFSLLRESISSAQLHTYTDASPRDYRAIAYVDRKI